MGEALVFLGYALMGISFVSSALYFIHWRTMSRRLRNRMRETYGEECCYLLRKSSLIEDEKDAAKGAGPS